MISHGELTKLLIDFEHKTPKQLPGFIAQVIQATSGGVAPEGGIRDTDASTTIGRHNGTQENSGFKFGAASKKELEGVDTRLVRVATLALQYSLVDFTVFDGLRTMKEQEQHVKNGTSKTMQSKHLQGLAVDLVPWINGKPVWDWDGCYKIACAVDRAATELGFAHLITWGGAWDRKLSDFGGDVGSYEQEVKLYASRHPGKDFLDGPHFEILGPKK